MNIVDEGITSYCYQICGSRGSVSCGVGQVCQEGIDVDTQMPAQSEDGQPVLIGAELDSEVNLDFDFKSQIELATMLAQQLLETNQVVGIGLHAAITAMVPHWKLQYEKGGDAEVINRDLQEIRKQIEDLSDTIVIPF